MNLFEKLAIGAIVLAVCASATLYGVWEDKVWLFAPLLMLITIALAVWIVAASRGRGRARGSTSHISHSTTHSIPPGGGMLLLFWLYSAVMIIG